MLGTLAVDAVRLVGVQARLFPLDMPMMLGLIGLGRAPRLQPTLMGEMVAMSPNSPTSSAP